MQRHIRADGKMGWQSTWNGDWTAFTFTGGCRQSHSRGNFKTFLHDDTFQVAIISNTEHFYFQHNDIVVPQCHTTPGPANQWWTRLTPSKSKVLISCKRDNHRSQVWSMQLDWSDLTKTWASSWHLPVMIILIILPQTPWSVLYALCTIMSVILLLYSKSNSSGGGPQRPWLR